MRIKYENISVDIILSETEFLLKCILIEHYFIQNVFQMKNIFRRNIFC